MGARKGFCTRLELTNRGFPDVAERQAQTPAPLNLIIEELGKHPPIAHCSCHTMLRQQLIRSLQRPAVKAGFNGSRTFTASARRPAEVEITVGRRHPPTLAATHANELCRWKEGVNRRYYTAFSPLKFCARF
jgi:hypothetical protein